MARDAARPQSGVGMTQHALSDSDLESASASSLYDEAHTALLPVASPREAERGTPDEGSGYKDRGWAIAFKINVVLTLVSAAWFGPMAIESLRSDSLSTAGRRRLHLDHDHGDGAQHHLGHPMTNIILGVASVIVIGAVVVMGMLHSIAHYGRGLLFTSYALFAGSCGVYAVIFFCYGELLLGAICAGTCALVVYLFRSRMHFIEFGAANLKVAALSVKSMPATIHSSIVMGLVQLLWCIAGGIAALGTFVSLETVTAPDGTTYRASECVADIFSAGDSAGHSCTCRGEKISDDDCEFRGIGGPLMIFWLASVAWGCAVIRNVVACTVTGSVASWWFAADEGTAPVRGAFYRATRTSFGSLCKAAVVHQFLLLVNMIGRRVLRIVPGATTLLSWVTAIVRYMLKYTIAFIGIYGLGFNEAGRRVCEVFKKRGLAPLANDTIVEVGLTLVVAIAFFIYFMANLLTVTLFLQADKATIVSEKSGEIVDTIEFWSIVGPQIFGAMSCMFFVATVLEVIRSGVKTVFVCFVHDADALAQKHGPEVHESLTAAWDKIQSSGRDPASELVGQPVVSRTRASVN